MNQSKDYIEYIIRKYFVEYNHERNDGKTIDELLKLLNECNIDRKLLEEVLLEELQINTKFYIISVNNWEYILVAEIYKDNGYIYKYRTDTMIDIKCLFLTKLRNKYIKLLIDEPK